MTLPLGAGRDKAVVLFRGDTGHRLEPVRGVGGALFYRPVFHGGGHSVGQVQIQLSAFVYGLSQGLVDIRREPCPHHPVVEYQASEIICDCCHNITSFPVPAKGCCRRPLRPGGHRAGGQQHNTHRGVIKEKAPMGQSHPLRHQRLFMGRNIHSMLSPVNSSGKIFSPFPKIGREAAKICVQKRKLLHSLPFIDKRKNL